MKPFDKEWVEKRAYALWEEEGRPHGRDAIHWDQAYQEYQALSQSAAKTKAGTRRRVQNAADVRQSPEAEMADVPQDPVPVTKPKRSRKGS
ncbi:DUF2934 domain-containing protein [Rhizobium paknamense]|uniref:DUF2934 domain-containing protein n=1 Tax=Rhizobium paknamense TaxID=1206817 RepID=A0ABU0IBH6_9HYPH|nr:DUF2934 domain-containing protein [Rhizobium paknamense]MDQ0455579.1 hypothetical protein [Rhizobium paknamense]